jgi:hypothetical protein
MTIAEFDRVIEQVLIFLEKDCISHPELYRKSGEDFEPCVKNAVDYALQVLNINAEVDYTPGGHGFPDIVIVCDDGNKFGIEVKSSSASGKSWKINGNSILGSTRVPGICKNMIVFGKVRGADSLFRAKEYEKCISNVVVTHSPRYLIDLDIDEGNSFFDKANLSYDDISKSDQPIKMITDYFLSIGQTAWWLAESTPAAIQMFGNLPAVQKGQLMGHAFVFFPEVFSNSGVKFYRYMSWLASENSIVDPALRDRFTAGGKADIELEHVIYEKLPRIFTNLHNYRKYVIDEIKNADPDELKEAWNQIPSVNLEERINQWAMVVADLIPNDGMEHLNKDQMLIDIVTDPLE